MKLIHDRNTSEELLCQLSANNILWKQFCSRKSCLSKFYKTEVFTKIDILCEKHVKEVDNTLTRINNLHSNLKFTIEKPCDGKIPFLDMKINNDKGHLSSTWYSKPTDTGLIMNFHSLAPKI